jgi:hypothetical protein
LGNFSQTHLVTLLSPQPQIVPRLFSAQDQGCQMVFFQTKNLDLGKCWRAFEFKKLVYYMAIWNILQPFGILYGHLVISWQIWYIFPVLVYCVKKNLAALLRICFPNVLSQQTRTSAKILSAQRVAGTAILPQGCQIFWVKHTKTEKYQWPCVNIPNGKNMMSGHIIYIPNGRI